MASSSDVAPDDARRQALWRELSHLLSAEEPFLIIEKVRRLQIEALLYRIVRVTSRSTPDENEVLQALRRLRSHVETLRQSHRDFRTLCDRLDVAPTDRGTDAVEALYERVTDLREQHRILQDRDLTAETAVQLIDDLRQQQRAPAAARPTEPSGRAEPEPFAGTSTEDSLRDLEALLDRLDAAAADGPRSARSSSPQPASLQALLHRSDMQPADAADWAATLQSKLNVTTPDEVVSLVQDLGDRLRAHAAVLRELRSVGVHRLARVPSMLRSMEQQLVALYDERRRWAAQGIDDVAAVADRLAHLQERVQSLSAANAALRDERDAQQATLHAVQTHFGTTDPEEIAALHRELRRRLQAQAVPGASSPSGAGSAPEGPSDADRFPSVENRSRTALDALDTGVVRVDADGIVQYANATIRMLPGVDAPSPEALHGRNFFFDVAPGTNNALFRGRFREGLHAGTLDAAFSYTFVHKEAAPLTATVRLEGASDDESGWILIAPLAGARPVPASDAESNSPMPSMTSPLSPPTNRPVHDDDSDSDATETASASAAPSPHLDFADDALPEALRTASEETLNAADFGIIRVDDDGAVLFFNEAEAELSGMRPEEVRGRNFFTQVAPCTNNRLFRGRFREGLKAGTMDETFSYTYTYKMRPTLVNVRLCRDAEGNNWIVVRKYGQSADSGSAPDGGL